MNMEEIWKNIEGYGNYQISSLGNVKKKNKKGFTHIKCSPRGEVKKARPKVYGGTFKMEQEKGFYSSR